MLTDSQRADIVAERDPQKRKEMVDKMTEEEAKDFIFRLLGLIHGEINTGFPVEY